MGTSLNAKRRFTRAMIIIKTNIPDVLIIEPRIFGDNRGFFIETFQLHRYQSEAGIDLPFVQDNLSRSCKGVVRGLHFQKSKPQGKLIRVVSGEIFDVAVDIRKESPTFKQWVGIVLCDKTMRQMWVPPGMAHGFAVLSESADLEYKCTDYYDPADEHCLLWDDPEIGIEWPVDNPVLSAKDQNGLLLRDLHL